VPLTKHAVIPTQMAKHGRRTESLISERTGAVKRPKVFKPPANHVSGRGAFHRPVLRDVPMGLEARCFLCGGCGVASECMLVARTRGYDSPCRNVSGFFSEC
jgi:hypothetical protein